MFRFGFTKDDNIEENNIDTTKSTIDWIPATKIEVSQYQTEKQYDSNDYSENVMFPGCKLKLIRPERALIDLNKENSTNILEAESQHSDLVPAKYEGGLKIWECSYDLSSYIFENNIDLQSKVVLDLGCGAGVIGLVALLKGSIVHFQDYNEEVIKAVTIPNVLCNFEEPENMLKKCEFFSGDWESFTDLKCSGDKNDSTKYDLIFSSETIYNPDNHKKLYEVFKQRLKQDGVGFIAAKSYYFGVGGGMRQFQTLIEKDGVFDIQIAWKSRDGLQREILKITRKEHLYS